MSKLIWVGVAAWWIGAFCPAARAQEVEAPAEDEEARAQYERGRQAFVEGDYETALDGFQSAWELSQEPVLLYNIGTVLDRLRRDREALQTFERFLELQTESDVVQEVRARVRVLRQRLGEEPTQSQQDQDRDQAALEPATEPRAAPASDSGSSGGRVFTWIAGGAAIAAAAGATVFGLMASSAFSDLEDGCGASGGCSEEQIDDSGVETKATLSNVLWGVTGAFAVTALILFFTEGGDDGDSSEVDVAVGPTGLLVRGTL